MLRTIWQSAYSASLYREVQHWRGKAFGYLAVLLALCWLPSLIQGQRAFKQMLSLVEKEVIQQIPVITYKNGSISTPENRPYVIRFGKDSKRLECIVDTSGKYQNLDNQTAQLLLTRDKLYIRKQSGEVRMYDLSKGKPQTFVVDQAFWQKILTALRRWTIPLLAPFIYALSYLKRLIQAFMIALIGLALVSALEVALDLGALLSLAIVAMTPAMLLQTVWSLTGLQHRYTWTLWTVLILGNFLYAVNAAARPNTSDSAE